MRKVKFECFLKVISPVHIGCGEVYEPMGFVIEMFSTNDGNGILFLKDTLIKN